MTNLKDWSDETLEFHLNGLTEEITALQEELEMVSLRLAALEAEELRRRTHRCLVGLSEELKRERGNHA